MHLLSYGPGDIHRDGLEQAGEPSAHSAGKRRSAGKRTGERAECGNAGERGRAQEGAGELLETAKIGISSARERAGVSAAVLFPSRDCNSTNPFLVEELALVCSRTYPTSTRITDHVLVAEVYSIQCLIIAWQPCREACTEGHSLGDKEDDAGYDCYCNNDRTSISHSPAQLPDDSLSSRSSVGPIKYFLRSQGARAVLTGETAFSSTSRPY